MAKLEKKMFNVRVPVDLLLWAKKYAVSRHTTVSQVVIDQLTKLKEEETNVRQI
jgi:hypothetical protein